MLKMQPEVASETSDMARKKTSGKSATQKPTSRAAVRKLSAHKPSPVKSAAPKGQPAKVAGQASVQAGCGQGRPDQEAGCRPRRSSRLPSRCAAKAAGQACARASATAQKAAGCRQAADAAQGRRHQAGHGSRCRPSGAARPGRARHACCRRQDRPEDHGPGRRDAALRQPPRRQRAAAAPPARRSRSASGTASRPPSGSSIRRTASAASSASRSRRSPASRSSCSSSPSRRTR